MIDIETRKKDNTRQQAIVLGIASMVVSLGMFATPMILVRVLGKLDFAQYRLLWLLANTAQLIAPLGLPRGLMYFLPRSESREKVQYITQALMLLCITALLAAILASPLNPLLPAKFYLSNVVIVPAFIFFWVIAGLVETLPTADQNFNFQAFALVSSTFVRITLVTVVASITGDVQYVFIALLVYCLYKIGILALYIQKNYGISLTSMSWAGLKEQISYSVPFGLTAIINNLRRQIEQWIVALVFLPEVYAIFSVGALEIPVLRLMRYTMGQVVFPKMSQAHGNQNYERVLYLNQSANLSTAFLVFPLVGFIFAFASPLVVLLFTQEYAEAALIFQIYLILTVARVIDVSNIMMIFSQKLFVTKVSLVLLFFSTLLSFVGAKTIGMAGAACGSVVAQVIITLITFRKATQLLHVRFKDLQDWRSLGHAMFGSVFAAALSYYGLGILQPDLTPLMKLVAGALLFLIIYLLALWLQGDAWVIKAFINKSDWREEFMKRKHSGKKDL